LAATFGGDEANVAVALSHLGVPASYVTVLPEQNPIADAAVAELRSHGVDTSGIPGDFSRSTVDEVNALQRDGGAGRVQR